LFADSAYDLNRATKLTAIPFPATSNYYDSSYIDDYGQEQSLEALRSKVNVQLRDSALCLDGVTSSNIVEYVFLSEQKK
jgi:hypothetical protein